MRACSASSAGKSAKILASVQRWRVADRVAVATRFSRTVRLGKIWRPSGTTPSPARAIRWDGQPAIALPSSSTPPRAGGTTPMMLLTVVVLPMPLRPSKVITSPSAKSSVTPNRIWLAP